MITIKKNPYTDVEKLALQHALNEAVTKFINDYCDPKAKCQTCEYRRVCYDLINARDYAYKIATGGESK
jgi:uncharacterized protein (UPF0179 family)